MKTSCQRLVSSAAILVSVLSLVYLNVNAAAEIVINIEPLNFGNIQMSESGEYKSTVVKCREDAMRLATEKQIETGQAHFDCAIRLLVNQDLKKQSGKNKVAMREGLQITIHLELALAKQFQTAECHAALGKIYLAAGDFPKSEQHLFAVVNTRPELGLPLARSLIAQGKTIGVQKHVELARDAFAKSMSHEAPPEGSVEEVKWLECLELLGEFDMGVAHLKSRIENDGAGDWAHHAVAQLCVSQFDVQARSSRAVSKTAIAALDMALRYRHDHESILKRWIVCVNQIPDQGDRQAEALRQLSDATLTAHADLVIGSVLHSNGHLAAAIDHLEQAYLEDPDDPAIMNNLAFYLSRGPRPELDRALQIAKRLIRRNPSMLHFRETRGQIYVRQENWEAGRRDLEAAEESMPKHIPLHRSLFLVYEKLDLSHLAAERAILLRRLESSSDP